MGYKDTINRFSSTRVGSWVARQTAAKIDPWLYRKSGGRITATGVPTIPQLVLLTIGRRSGKRRAAQVAYLEDGGDFLVVASNFGQAHHPAWALNLEAEPDAVVHVGERRVEVRAERVSEAEKTALWPRLDAIVPQFHVYRQRTDRDIRIFRLRPRGTA
jgi:deazaflavin-dependent oxidoreductase (nitroreductase family)